MYCNCYLHTLGTLVDIIAKSTIICHKFFNQINYHMFPIMCLNCNCNKNEKSRALVKSANIVHTLQKFGMHNEMNCPEIHFKNFNI